MFDFELHACKTDTILKETKPVHAMRRISLLQCLLITNLSQ